MKKLHLVGFTKDNDGLILSLRKGAKSGGYVVTLDDQLMSSIVQARQADEGEPVELTTSGARDGAAPVVDVRKARPRSALSPREIQARLRAGSTTADVAAQAGVEEEWVLRFADPILAEQAQVVASAQRLTLAKSRLGPSAEPLGQAVQWNLTDRGVRFSDDVFSDCWSAFNLHGARWAVRFSYTSRQRRQVAEWEVDLRERSLAARNRLASDLGHVEAGRRRPRLEGQEQGQLEPAGPLPGTPGGRPAAAPRSSTARPGRAAASARAAGGKAAPRIPKAAGARTKPATSAKAVRGAARSAGTKAVAAAPGPETAPAAAATGRPTAPTRRSGRSPAAANRAKVQSTAAKRPAAKMTAAKKSGRESAPRKSRPSKKPAPDKPAGAGLATAADLPEESVPDRPSHLARPPSPMNMANRAASLPGRRFGAPYQQPQGPSRASRAAAPSTPARQRPAPAARVDVPGEARPTEPPPAPGRPGRSPRPDTVRWPEGPLADSGSAAGSAGPAPTVEGPSPADAPEAGAGSFGHDSARWPVAPPIRRPPSTVGPDREDDDQRPAVVILSTPPSSSPSPAGERRTGARGRDEGRG